MLSTLMALVMVCAMSVPAFAAVQDTGFSDVVSDACYARAVAYRWDQF